MSHVDAPTPSPDEIPYEARLHRDGRLAMSEMGRFFEGESGVHRALLRITRRLTELNIPYALCGGMALNQHGYRRTTDDVDLLVTRDALRTIHENLEGLGYVTPFAGSKNLRDTEEGVRIEFLIAGDYPGDGKPKPVAFPNPIDVATERNGLKVLNLAALIELKLASGMTNPGRLKDLADVQEIARVLELQPEYAERLNPYVRAKFVELVAALGDGAR